MKIALKESHMYADIQADSKKIVYSLTILITLICSFNNLYGYDEFAEKQSNGLVKYNANINADLDQAILKGYAENNSDFLQWEVLDAFNVKFFTVECSKNNDMKFTEIVNLKPEDCNDLSMYTQFTFKCNNIDEYGTAYYKIKITYKDNSTSESNFIAIERTENIVTLNISEIKNETGMITVTFKSPKAQNITLNILNKSGQLLIAKNIEATKGDNIFSYDASFLPSYDMLIFLLNNQEELITKKYMLAAAY